MFPSVFHSFNRSSIYGICTFLPGGPAAPPLRKTTFFYRNSYFTYENCVFLRFSHVFKIIHFHFHLPKLQKYLHSGFLAAQTPPDGPAGGPDGLWTGLLTPQTASDGPSPADKFTCRQDHLPTSPPASQVSPGAKRAFDACTFLPLTPYCRDSLLDKTAARRT